MEQFLCYSPKNHRTARHRARCERDRRASASHQIHINAAASRLPAGRHRPLNSQFCLQLTTAFCRILLMGEFVFHVDPHPRSFRNSGSQVQSSQQPLILVDGLDVWFIPACNILYVYPHTIIRTAMYAQGNNTRSIYEPVIN